MNVFFSSWFLVVPFSEFAVGVLDPYAYVSAIPSKIVLARMLSRKPSVSP
jgi:hypothetical protein